MLVAFNSIQIVFLTCLSLSLHLSIELPRVGHKLHLRLIMNSREYEENEEYGWGGVVIIKIKCVYKWRRTLDEEWNKMYKIIEY